MSYEKLFGVKDGKFYVRSPPTFAKDDWLSSATEIGSGGWGAFSHLFFHPDGTLYGVMNGKFYKGHLLHVHLTTGSLMPRLLVKGDGIRLSFFSLIQMACFMVPRTECFTKELHQHAVTTIGKEAPQ